MNNFYLTLLSDSSLSTFSKNTQCDFKVKLDHSLQIEKDNWEMGLVEIITPTEVNNITKENNYVILRFSDRKMCDEKDNCTNYGFYVDQKNPYPKWLLVVEEPGFKNVKNKHLGMPPF